MTNINNNEVYFVVKRYLILHIRLTKYSIVHKGYISEA